MQELYYGGWAAPNVYYLGAAGVVRYRGIRIGGVSGIYKYHDYRKARHEYPPYDNSTLRSVYHVRNIEVARLKVLNHLQKSNSDSAVDLMLSHDWPRGIEQHGDTNGLIRRKKFFRQEIQDNSLGSPSNEELLHSLKPKWWFAAHLHVKFQASFQHIRPETGAPKRESSKAVNTLIPSSLYTSNTLSQQETIENEEILPPTDTNFIALESSNRLCSDETISDLTDLMTQFLALDKCLPRKHHLQIVNIPVNSTADDKDAESSPNTELHYDLEWLAILQKTHHWTNSSRYKYTDPNCEEITVSDDDVNLIRENLRIRLKDQYMQNGDDPTVIPQNFKMTVQPHGTLGSEEVVNGGQMVGNPQTDELLQLLGMSHVITIPYVFSSSSYDAHQKMVENQPDDNEIDLEDDDMGINVDTSVDGGAHLDSNEIDLDSDNSAVVDLAQTDSVPRSIANAHNDENEIDLE